MYKGWGVFKICDATSTTPAKKQHSWAGSFTQKKNSSIEEHRPELGLGGRVACMEKLLWCPQHHSIPTT
jgi:hypothetical protein